MIGQKPSDKVFQDAGQKAADAVTEPMSDTHASGEYRRYLAQVMTRRALAEAVSRVA